MTTELLADFTNDIKKRPYFALHTFLEEFVARNLFQHFILLLRNVIQTENESA